MPAYALFPSLVLLVGGCNATEPTTLGISFQMVSAGRDYSCGLASDGTPYCWGDFPGVPVVLSGGVKFAMISVRFLHACGVGQDGVAYCWGDNSVGQLGQSAGTLFQTPARVPGSLTFRSIAVGLSHTCALTRDDALYCWGANHLGQVGVDSVTSSCDLGAGPTGVACTPVPVPVQPDLKFRSLSVGDYHSCALTLDDIAYCWGRGDGGELGDGGSANRRAPALVAGGLKFLAISAGGRHTCAVTAGHDAYCWGSNTDLQLGSLSDDASCTVGLLRCTTVPFAVTGGLKFDSITTSEAVPYAGTGPVLGGHSCGLSADGHVFCWGLNELGQLGGSQDLRSYRPVALNGDSLFVQISAGRTHTCGVKQAGEVRCWNHGNPRGL